LEPSSKFFLTLSGGASLCFPSDVTTGSRPICQSHAILADSRS
jgi:hypothetical protein